MINIQSIDLVIYHKDCFDGFTAAWVASKKFPHAVFLPQSHDCKPPDVTGKNVLIVDICFSASVMRYLDSQAASIVVLDHHQTAVENMFGVEQTLFNTNLIFDMQRSGAGLCWDYLFPESPRPAIVTLTEDRDLWRFDHRGTREMYAVMCSREMTFPDWNELEEQAQDIPALLETGGALLDYIGATAKEMANNIQLRKVAYGEATAVFAVVNVHPRWVSETADIVWEKYRLPTLGWFYEAHSDRYRCSLRTRADTMDVSHVARFFGGGGHRKAAGFSLPHPPLQDPALNEHT